MEAASGIPPTSQVRTPFSDLSLQLRVAFNPSLMSFDMYVVGTDSKKRYVVENITLRTITEDGTIAKPLFSLNESQSIVLVNSLVAAGVKPTTSVDQDSVVEAMRSHIETLRDTVSRLFAMLVREQLTPLTPVASSVEFSSAGMDSQRNILNSVINQRTELQGKVNTLQRVIEDKNKNLFALRYALRKALDLMPETASNGDLILRFNEKTWTIVPTVMKGPIARGVIIGLGHQIQKFREDHKEAIEEAS